MSYNLPDMSIYLLRVSLIFYSFLIYYLDIANAYVWLLHLLISEVREDIKDKVSCGLGKRQAQLESQSEKYKMITYAYCELTILNCFRESLQTAPEFIQEVLRRLVTMYAYNSIDKYTATLYIG